jgi:hypothetical protein
VELQDKRLTHRDDFQNNRVGLRFDVSEVKEILVPLNVELITSSVFLFGDAPHYTVVESIARSSILI